MCSESDGRHDQWPIVISKTVILRPILIVMSVVKICLTDPEAERRNDNAPRARPPKNVIWCSRIVGARPEISVPASSYT